MEHIAKNLHCYRADGKITLLNLILVYDLVAMKIVSLIVLIIKVTVTEPVFYYCDVIRMFIKTSKR